MNIFQRVGSITRSGEWWTWKIPMFLTAALVIIHASGETQVWEVAWKLALMMLGMAVGAVFVSVLNDFTDLDDDRKAGKSNRLEGLSPFFRSLSLGLTILMVLVYLVYGMDDKLSRLYYAAACLSFVVYSVPPFRVKKKAAWGGVADALGASLFPTLFVAAQMQWTLGYEMASSKTTAMFVWALAHGLRGILWHQHRDREHDESIGSRTFATQNRLHTLMVIEPLIVIVEMTSFLLFVDQGILPLMVLLLSLHLVMVFLSHVLLGVWHTMVVSPSDREQYMLYGTFYQVLVPIAFILTISGLSSASMFLTAVLLLLVFPDVRINYYLVKRMVYENRMVRLWLRRRDAIRAPRDRYEEQGP